MLHILFLWLFSFCTISYSAAFSYDGLKPLEELNLSELFYHSRLIGVSVVKKEMKYDRAELEWAEHNEPKGIKKIGNIIETDDEYIVTEDEFHLKNTIFMNDIKYYYVLVNELTAPHLCIKEPVFGSLVFYSSSSSYCHTGLTLDSKIPCHGFFSFKSGQSQMILNQRASHLQSNTVTPVIFVNLALILNDKDACLSKEKDLVEFKKEAPLPWFAVYHDRFMDMKHVQWFRKEDQKDYCNFKKHNLNYCDKCKRYF